MTMGEALQSNWNALKNTCVIEHTMMPASKNLLFTELHFANLLLYQEQIIAPFQPHI